MNRRSVWQKFMAEHADKTPEQLERIHRRLCREAAELTGQAARADRLRRMKLRERKRA